MHFQRVHGDHAPERVFRSVVNAGSDPATEGITRGDVLVWDITDNTGTAGIMTDTRGARVIKLPINEVTGNREARIAGVAEMAGPVTATGQFRNDSFAMQVSGFHDAVKVTGNTVQYRHCTMSNVVGTAIQAGATDPTIPELIGSVGWFLETATAPGTAPVMLRGLL
jgi:hypothetical protein